MARKPRDYKAEYAKRVASGKSKGLSFKESVGRAKIGSAPQSRAPHRVEGDRFHPVQWEAGTFPMSLSTYRGQPVTKEEIIAAVRRTSTRDLRIAIYAGWPNGDDYGIDDAWIDTTDAGESNYAEVGMLGWVGSRVNRSGFLRSLESSTDLTETLGRFVNPGGNVPFVQVFGVSIANAKG